MSGPYILGLTGGIGQGKSTIAQSISNDMGIRVIDSDKIVHTLYSSGGRAINPIRAVFPSVIGDSGVDRTALAAVLKAEPEKLKTLENIVHPLVKEVKIQELHEAASNREDIVILDVPLMFETNSERMCDAVMVVTAEFSVQKARVMKRPGMTTEKFEFLIARQMNEEERLKRANYIVRTDVSLQDTMESVVKILDEGGGGTIYLTRHDASLLGIIRGMTELYNSPNGSRGAILCKYYMHGACNRGESCPFSHDLTNAPNTVCTHWLRGSCTFGDKCRYDHVRPEWAPKGAPSGSEGYEAPSGVLKPETSKLHDILPISRLYISKDHSEEKQTDLGTKTVEENQMTNPLRIDLPADPFGPDDRVESVISIDRGLEGASTDVDGNGSYTSEINVWGSYGGIDGEASWIESEVNAPYGGNIGSLCYEFYNTGACSSATCKLLHGRFCEICESYALHPSDESEAQLHVSECTARHERLKARARSIHVECCICLERVLEKTGGDRKFGLLSCEHAFCLSCIRSWRSNLGGGADVNSALRTCPVCRVTTHYITPSLTWPETQEEKDIIISGYKAKLASIDCKNFNFGKGTCPFGTSCMYRHAFPDGSLEDSAPRRVAVDEGEVKYVQPVKLSDFLEIRQGRVRGRRG